MFRHLFIVWMGRAGTEPLWWALTHTKHSIPLSEMTRKLVLPALEPLLVFCTPYTPMHVVLAPVILLPGLQGCRPSTSAFNSLLTLLLSM